MSSLSTYLCSASLSAHLRLKALRITVNFVLNEPDRYGEIVNINLVRDKKTGKSKGFCFVCYEDQRSTVLAVDNFNGIKVSRKCRLTPPPTGSRTVFISDLFPVRLKVGPFVSITLRITAPPKTTRTSMT